MPFTYKVLGQQAGTNAIGTYATLVNEADPTIVSSLVICNQDASAMTYRVAVCTASATPSVSEFIVYGSTVPGNDTVTLTLGLTLQANKAVKVSSSTSTGSFAAFGTTVS